MKVKMCHICQCIRHIKIILKHWKLSEAGKKSCLFMEYAVMAWQMDDIFSVLHSVFLYCDLKVNILSYAY